MRSFEKASSCHGGVYRKKRGIDRNHRLRLIDCLWKIR